MQKLEEDISDKRKCPECGRIVNKEELHGKGCLFCLGHY